SPERGEVHAALPRREEVRGDQGGQAQRRAPGDVSQGSNPVVTRKQIAVLWASVLIPALGCPKGPDTTKPQAPVTPDVEAGKKAPSHIALTSAATGQVFLVDRESLELVRTVEPEKTAPSDGPMLVAEDRVRRVFYVGNFNGGLGRIPADGSKPGTLDLGGVL